MPEQADDPGLPYRIELFTKNFLKEKGYDPDLDDGYLPKAVISVESVRRTLDLQSQMVSTFIKIFAAVFCLILLTVSRSRQRRPSKAFGKKKRERVKKIDPTILGEAISDLDFLATVSKKEPNFAPAQADTQKETLPPSWKGKGLASFDWQENFELSSYINLKPMEGSWHVAALGKCHPPSLKVAFQNLPLDEAIALLGKIPISDRTTVYDKLAIQPALRRRIDRPELTSSL